MTECFEHRGLRAAIGAALMLVCIYTLYRGWILNVEYFDGYIYLTNADRLSGDQNARFDSIRPPLLSLIQAPVVWYARTMGPANEWLLRAPHLISSCLSLLALATIFVVFRPFFGSTLALLGALVFSGTRYFAHYGAHVMTDIPVAALTVAAVGLYVHARAYRSRADYVLCGVAMGFAILMKYSALLVFPALVLAEALLLLCAKLRKTNGALDGVLYRRRLSGLILSGVMAGSIVLITLVTVFFTVYGLTAWSALADAAANLSPVVSGNPTESPVDHLSMAAVMLSYPVLLLAGTGLVAACIGPRTTDVIFFCYLAVVGGGVVVFVGHTEARYLLPSVPAIIYFVIRGVETGLSTLEKFFDLTAHRQGLIVLLLAILVLEVSVQNGVRQAWADHEPFFTDDIQRRTSESVLSSRGDHGRLWVLGRWHTLFPPLSGAGPMPEDEYWNMFHSSPVVIEYYLGERLVPLPLPTAPASSLAPMLGRFLRNGDAVLRLDNVLVTTVRMLPGATPKSLEVWSIDSIELLRDPNSNRLSSEDRQWTGTLEAGTHGGHILLSQSFGRRDVYITSKADGQPLFAGIYSLPAGTSIALSEIDADTVQSVMLQSIGVETIDLTTVSSRNTARN